jgi:DNA adenine methylase
MTEARPFVKWIGGKRSVIDHLRLSLPKTFKRYYEPFIGGGALFFAEGYKSAGASISDLNGELINAYQIVALHPEELIEALKVHASKSEHDYYYEVRANIPPDRIGRAARLLYMLKTCFNGLYRENAKGEFNASWGYYKQADVVQPENIRACSKALAGVSITERPCWNVRPSEGDFIYFDPPYYDSYVGYNAKRFDTADHIRLRNMALRLARKGVSVMISNSDEPFVRELYSDPVFRKQVVCAKRLVGGTTGNRGPEGELLITTYEVQK